MLSPPGSPIDAKKAVIYGDELNKCLKLEY